MFGDRYIGTFAAADQIPSTMSNGQSCILNTDRSDMSGRHWTAVTMGNTGNTVYAYDSFGRKIRDLIALPWPRVIDAEQDAEQLIDETNCGARCLSWLHIRYSQGIRAALSI